MKPIKVLKLTEENRLKLEKGTIMAQLIRIVSDANPYC